MSSSQFFDEFLSWMFINLMVGLGLVSLAAYPPFLRTGGSPRGRYWRDVTAAGVMAVFCMFYVWSPGPGMKIDIRMVPLGLTGWVYGWPAAAMVGAFIIFARYLMGGVGVFTTVFYTIACVALVPFFHGRPRRLHTLALLGLVQTVVGYAVGQLAYRSQPAGLEPFSPVWPFLAGFQIVSFWCVNGVIENLTERQRLQTTLTHALKSKEAILQFTPHAILALDAKGRVTDFNRAASDLLGGRELPAEIRSHPDVQSAVRERRRLDGCRVTMLDARGAEQILLVTIVPLADGDSLLGVENVTTVIQEEREEARRKRLELLGRMAAMAAHEIKNPLTTIKGFLQILAGRAEFAAHRNTFALVQGEVEHINRVIGDFLDLSGTAALHPVCVDLDALLQEVVAGMDLQFPENGVAVSLEGEAGLQAVADRKSLKQILRNLVANAYEAMPSGGRLTLRRERCEGGYRIDVSDTGAGIAPEVLPNIFTPYMTTKSTGTGLGLAISHKLAADMGADLSVRSEPGQGSTFRLQLPAATPVAQVAAAAELPSR